VESVLDRPQRLRLVVSMRGNFRALMGNPTGHYSLDLANGAPPEPASHTLTCVHLSAALMCRLLLVWSDAKARTFLQGRTTVTA
jgi:hypothetical protein